MSRAHADALCQREIKRKILRKGRISCYVVMKIHIISHLYCIFIETCLSDRHICGR
jgi:hypothetical protein